MESTIESRGEKYLKDNKTMYNQIKLDVNKDETRIIKKSTKFVKSI